MFGLLWVVGDGWEVESFLETFVGALGWLRAGARGAMGGGVYLSSGAKYGEHGMGKSQ